MKTLETFLVQVLFKVAPTALETVTSWLIQKYGRD
jgi:hypothetical protein